MPKAAPFQPSFSGGEFSPRVKGRADNERYKTALDTCINYIPTTQGPLVRRPGFKYAGNNVKDTAKPPAFYEFRFSQTQNYILEFGDKYLRFYTNNGQIVTSSTHFKVAGQYGRVSSGISVTVNSARFFAHRFDAVSQPGERILASSVIAAGSVLEIETPYVWPDTHNLKTGQREDVMFITCSTYPEFKLSRFGNTQWDLRRVLHHDGPYLPFNSYRTPADSARVWLIAGAPTIIYPDSSHDHLGSTGPIRNVNNMAASPGGEIRVTSTAHDFASGDKVVVLGVAGTTESVNGTSTLNTLSWTVKRVDADNFDLAGSVFVNAYVGSGLIYPALWQAQGVPTNFVDVTRNLGLININGGRSWTWIHRIHDMARFEFHIATSLSPPILGTSAGDIHLFWNLGTYSALNGYPDAVTFHQGRQFLAGTPAYPQQIDGSVPGDYENFAASGSSLVVTDASAIQQTLDSETVNPVHWLKSDTHGLLAGTANSEWNIAPNSAAAALTPTNFNATETGSFGSHNAQGVKAGNGSLYIQAGQRRIREMNFFFQVDTYRSTDLAELSDHVTNPGLSKIFVQKEPIPIVWGLKTDGRLTSMVYSRDDVALKAGWSRHVLGGQSDSAFTDPIIKTAAAIPSPDGTYDQVWAAVTRFINGTSVCTVEYIKKFYDDNSNIEDAVYLDCSGTYDSPVTITGVSIGGSSIVTAPSHGFANDDFVKISEVVGVNSSTINESGTRHFSSLINSHVFKAGSVSANAFFLMDMNDNYVPSIGYSVYVSGGEARKLVNTISGATWLKNETIDVLCDGKIHPPVTVNSAGVFSLTYPAAVVQFGYKYNSDAKVLRAEAGSADGTSIGKVRKTTRAAFMLHNLGDFRVGTSFDNLTPYEFDQPVADEAAPLFSGIKRETVQSEYNFDSQLCWRENSPLPGMVQSLTLIMEVQDV